ncbi:hypothetical protein PILCRDRAFT_820723 [Piloderma croceum F 1598]|uniref:Uncharacterized protein n=1 Tax=Piloderma croceum (strain F 1598) TaxID=765440 RepID=A0A0C3B7R5_PILCF|nr:hypothetical protein PILCRDRAFT_820723 [Piloderma croceum F 1598]
MTGGSCHWHGRIVTLIAFAESRVRYLTVINSILTIDGLRCKFDADLDSRGDQGMLAW